MVLAMRGRQLVRSIGARAPTATMSQARKRAEGTGEGPHSSVVERIAGGDRDAMAQLYDSTGSLVFGLALRVLGDRQAAEDVLIDVYAEVWRRADSFERTRGTVAAWLLTITRTRAIDVLRSRRRKARAETMEAASVLTVDAPSPEDTALAVERRQLVHAALELLVPDQLEAIQLAYFKGLSHSEIARQLGQPLGTVKTRIRLGMVRLRELLGPVTAPLPMAKGKTG
jgi:RNA polymerase sigma-70 factor (ECF subfamily)